MLNLNLVNFFLVSFSMEHQVIIASSEQLLVLKLQVFNYVLVLAGFHFKEVTKICWVGLTHFAYDFLVIHFCPLNFELSYFSFELLVFFFEEAHFLVVVLLVYLSFTTYRFLILNFNRIKLLFVVIKLLLKQLLKLKLACLELKNFLN